MTGLGTALPPHAVTQREAEAFVVARLPADGPSRTLARRVFRGAAIERRHACVPDFSLPDPALPDSTLADVTPSDPGADGPALYGVARPGTAARMQAFRRHAPGLAADACRAALADAGRSAEDVTHLVVVTCTGFFAPGPDTELVERLGLRPTVRRTIVGFMGCYAAFNGLRLAREAVGAGASAVALVVCVELCSLHANADPDPENLVSQALFGDGAAACVVEAAPSDGGLLELGPEATCVQPGTAGHMGWTIGDDGFRMRLSSWVPALLGEDLGGFVAAFAGDVPVDGWAVHPGGKAILDHAERALDLGAGALTSSRAVLRRIGNVSSATVLFVLSRELGLRRPGERIALLGFGPGLTLEGLLGTRGAAVHDGSVHDGTAAQEGTAAQDGAGRPARGAAGLPGGAR